jgi:predicted PurR-regulated permease PerM
MRFALFKKTAKSEQIGAPSPAEPAKFPSHEDVVSTYGGSNLPGWIFLPTTVLVVAILYWAQEVLVPIAIATLLAFVLNPVVSALERLRIGRIAAVTISVILTFAILIAVGWLVARQLGGLAQELPQYRKNIRAKVADLRKLKRGGALERVEETVTEVKEELKKQEAGANRPAPHQVVVAAEQESAFWPIPLATGPVIERLAAAGLAIVLVIFMLIQREELRNRLIRVLGYGRLTVTTKALEEAGQRISHYLLVQFLINSGFGVAVGVILFFIGIPYALLWGFMAILLRFIPYIGPWLAAIMPTALSLAYFPGWLTPMLVIGVFIVFELTTNLLLEPLFYGESAGVSEIAILVMAAFWTWLWGPVGLVLALPLTVCLVVFSKYVPEMTFVTVLLSDAPALDPHVNYYQRLLAEDEDEGEQIVEEYLEEHSPAELYDNVILPALSRAKADRRRGQLTKHDEETVYRGSQAILEDIEESWEEATTDQKIEMQENAGERTVQVLGLPADGKGDEIALLTLKKILDPRRCRMEVLSADMLASEMVARVGDKSPPLICIGAVAPGGLAHARYLCKRIRARFPDIRILVGRWGPQANLSPGRASLGAAGADRIANTLQEARDQLLPLISLEPSEKRAPTARRTAL